MALPGLRKTAVIEALNEAGQYSSRRLWLKILVRWAAIESIPACSALFMIPSGPGALRGDAARIAVRTSFSSIGGISIWPLYVACSMSSRSASGGVGKKTSRNSSAFSAGSSSSRWVLGCCIRGIHPLDWLCLVRAHLASFHSAPGDSAACSMRSLCALRSALRIVLALWFLAAR